MTSGIAESFFNRLTLLQGETPAVTRFEALLCPFNGKRLRGIERIAWCASRRQAVIDSNVRAIASHVLRA
jgi:hypothetical protein